MLTPDFPTPDENAAYDCGFNLDDGNFDQYGEAERRAYYRGLHDADEAYFTGLESLEPERDPHDRY